jgi:hypothetical protein
MEGFFLVWVLFAVLVGVLASNRGRSGLGWGLLSLLLSPILCGIILLVIADLAKEEQHEYSKRREEEKRAEERQREHEKQILALKAIAEPKGDGGTGSVADEIGKLGALLEKGLITDEEFKVQKSALLK